MRVLKFEMITLMCNSMTTCVWLLLSFFLVVIDGETFSITSVVHRGNSVNISCNYNLSNGTENVVVKLETNNKLCSVMIMNKSCIKQSCTHHYGVGCNPETNKIFFEMFNLQINDTGIYKCVVQRAIPPPVMLLGEERTFVVVNAQPNVSVSRERSSDGFPMILCSSEGFYPSAIEQLWMRNGEFLNVSLTHNMNKTNPDGSFTLHSYLNTSDCENYLCWVNHSTLSRPTTLHMSPADCYENKTDNQMVIMVIVISLLLILIIMIITVVCERFRRAHRRSPVSVNVEPNADLQVHLQSEIYSTLGDHHAVPVSPVRVRSSAQYTPYQDIIYR